MKVFGHRGSAGRFPENTMMSFEGAWNDGADGIELDVQFTKDGVLVVIHDETVNRTTNGVGFVKEYSYQELKQLDASMGGEEKATIPTLEEVFNWALGNDLILNIELKNGLIMYYGLEEEVINLIRRYGYEKRVILSSFNHLSIWKCGELAQDIERALIATRAPDNIVEYTKKYKSNGIHLNYKYVSLEIIQLCKANQIKIRTYTVNTLEKLQLMIELQIDGLMTDYPRRAVWLLNQKS